MKFISNEIENYCKQFSLNDNSLLSDLVEKTKHEENLPQMICGSLVGGVLQLLIQISKAKKILEIGMFTGYSTLKMAESIPDDGEIHSCELMKKHIDTASKWFDKANFSDKIVIHEGPALSSMNEFSVGSFDMIFVDADKANYPQYYRRGNALLKKGGIAVFDNMLWEGKVIEPKDRDSIAIRETAELIKKNPRLTPILLPVRDGILIYQKRE